MINATYEKDGRSYHIDIVGHANYAPKGFDVICAGISTLVYTAAAVCEKYEAKGMIDNFKFVDEPGHSEISYTSRIPIAADLIMSHLTTGIGLIAAQYPDYVSVGEKSKK